MRNVTGYTGNNTKVRDLINISHEDVIDWSPYSFPREKYSCSELRWQPYSLNETVAISSTVVDEPIQ